MYRKMIVVFLAVMVLVLGAVLLQGKTTKTQISKDDLAVAIEAYVSKQSQLQGGFFLVYDGQTQKPLVLKLAKVHRERLARVGDGIYFACADFTASTGKTYDLDVFMKGPDKNSLIPTEISVHKEDGQERYTWFEKDGVWHKKNIAAKGTTEHPSEHPKEKPSEHPKENPTEG